MSPRSINKLLKVTVFQTPRIKPRCSFFYKYTHCIPMFIILWQNPDLCVSPYVQLFIEIKNCAVFLFKVELFAVILPVRKNPDPWGS